MTDVFISYKHRMIGRVAPIAEALRSLGLEVWYDAGLVSGSDYADAIAKHLRAARSVLVCWTDDAFPHGGDKNGWVRGEAEKGRERNTLVAVMLEETDLDPPWNMVHYERLTEWTPQSTDRGSWQRVLSAIGALVERPGLGDYDKALQAGTSTALSDWARTYASDPLATAARARAKELYLAEAAAKFEAEEDDRQKGEERARQAEREAREKADIQRIRRTQQEAKEQAEREARDGAERAAREKAANTDTGAEREDADPVLSRVDAVLTPRDVLVFCGVGLLVCCVGLFGLAGTGYMRSMVPGVPIAVACIALFSLPLALRLWRSAKVEFWRAAAMAVGVPAIGLLAGFLPNFLYGYQPFITFGVAALAGVVTTLVLLLILRLLPHDGSTMLRAAATVAFTTVVTAAVAATIGGTSTPMTLAWLALGWQLSFTLGLAATAWPQRARSASSM